MTTPLSADSRPASRLFLLSLSVCGALVLASLAAVSAHTVKGLQSETLATAFVSSPSVGGDAPIPLSWGMGDAKVDTGLRVACFYAANSSPKRVDRRGWPRVTVVGFELPGAPSGFALVEPRDGNWELIQGARASLPGHRRVTLDFAVRARVKARGAPGLPPGEEAKRGAGTRFCVSGPFPDTLPNLLTEDPNDTVPTTIELLINGVVVLFQGVDDGGNGVDGGVWAPTLPLTRPIPMYP